MKRSLVKIAKMKIYHLFGNKTLIFLTNTKNISEEVDTSICICTVYRSPSIGSKF